MIIKSILRLFDRTVIYSIIILIIALFNIIYLYYAWSSHHQKQHELTNSTAEKINSLSLSLDKLLTYGESSIREMEPSIRAAKGERDATYEILRERVDEGAGIVRFGWSDPQLRLVAGSARGIHEPPYDLSDRDYIQFTSQHPHRFTLSHILPHVRTRGDIIALAYGIYATDGAYLGTLAAIYYLDGLRQFIQARMSDCDCSYAVLSPHGEAIIAQGEPAAPPSLSSGAGQGPWRFIVNGQPTTAALHHLLLDAASSHLSILVLFNAVMAATLYWLRRHILLPVDQALQALAPSTGGTHDPLMQRLQRLSQLGEEYSHMRTQLEISETQLEEAQLTIADLSQSQQLFFHASGTQMDQAHEAITQYSHHLEDMVIARRIDADATYDFDEVREMGANLSVLAGSFQRICAIKQGYSELLREQVPLRALTEMTLQQLSGAIERRNLVIGVEGDETVIEQDGGILQQLLWALLYVAVRHGEDEARLHIDIRDDTEQTGCIAVGIELSCYRQSALPAEQQDFSMFMPSRVKDMTADYDRHLRRHANILVAESFLALSGSHLSIEVRRDKTLRFDMRLHPLTTDNSRHVVVH